MNKFFYLLVATFFALASIPVQALEKDEDCGIYCHGYSRKIIPNKDVRCVPFTQPHPDTVVLTLTLKDGSTRPYRKVNAGTDDCIPVGRHWLRDKTVSMTICNDENHADYPYEDVQAVAHQEKMARVKENVACLFGRDICQELGYKYTSPK